MTQNNMEVVAWIDSGALAALTAGSKHGSAPAYRSDEAAGLNALDSETAIPLVTLTSAQAEIATLKQAVDAFADICDELGCERDNEAGLQAAHALKAERDALREALVLAEEVARDITASPAGSLWNYGTKPSRLDEAKWQGSREAAEAILAALQPLEPKND